MQGVTPVNADNPIDCEAPFSVAEKPATLLTRSDIKALMRQEKGSATSLDWKPPYPPRWLQSHIPGTTNRNFRSMMAGVATPTSIFYASSNLWVSTPTKSISASKNSQVSDRPGVYFVRQLETRYSTWLDASRLLVQFQILLSRSQAHPRQTWPHSTIVKRRYQRIRKESLWECPILLQSGEWRNARWCLPSRHNSRIQGVLREPVLFLFFQLMKASWRTIDAGRKSSRSNTSVRPSQAFIG